MVGRKGLIMAKEEKKDKKPLKHAKTNGYHKTITEHHPDGSHSTEHHHEDGSVKKYARPDHDGMMDGLMENLSGPGPEEIQAMSGGHGVPAQIASKAGLPGDSGTSQAE
jgi:hypothetical protein